MKKLTKRSFPRSFGVFSPTGHAIIALATDDDAEEVRQMLLRNGFGEEDVTHYNKNEVLWEFERSEEHAVNLFKIEQEVAKFEEYLELASQGCGFLVVHTPEDEVAKRAVQIAMAFGLKFAEKYKRWTLEELA
jgi:hypothetical protein